jgi:hypothetical protein
MVTFRVFTVIQPRLARIAPTHRLSALLLHSTPLLSIASALFSSTALTQPFSFQSLPHSFYRNGGIPPSRYLHRLALLQSPLFPVVHPVSLQPLTKCSSRNSFALTTTHFHGGCIPPISIFFDAPLIRSLLFSTPAQRESARNAHFCAPIPLFVTLAQKQGGGGSIGLSKQNFAFHNADPARQTLPFYKSLATSHNIFASPLRFCYSHRRRPARRGGGRVTDHVCQ